MFEEPATPAAGAAEEVAADVYKRQGESCRRQEICLDECSDRAFERNYRSAAGYEEDVYKRQL